jgi:hypothetical protein
MYEKKMHHERRWFAESDLSLVFFSFRFLFSCQKKKWKTVTLSQNSYKGSTLIFLPQQITANE